MPKVRNIIARGTAPKARNIITRGTAPKVRNITRGTAPKARNIIARGKSRLCRDVAPGTEIKIAAQPWKGGILFRPFRPRSLFLMHLTRGDALRACPWLLYFAPLALLVRCGLALLRKSATRIAMHSMDRFASRGEPVGNTPVATRTRATTRLSQTSLDQLPQLQTTVLTTNASTRTRLPIPGPRPLSSTRNLA